MYFHNHNAKVDQEPHTSYESTSDHSDILKTLIRDVQNKENAYLHITNNDLY